MRSSATAEDLPEASFAGQQETFLNVSGKENVLKAMHEVFASLFNDRAIAYRVHQNFDHNLVALSAGVQHMVRSDIGASGVMFTLDTDSGFRDVVFVTASYGLGQTIVQGAVNPDEFYVYKPTLASGHDAVLRRGLGSKQQKMIYSDTPGERVRIVETAAVAQRRFDAFRAPTEEGFVIVDRLRQSPFLGLDTRISDHDCERKGQCGVAAVQPVAIVPIVGLVAAHFERRGFSNAFADRG